MAPFVVGVTLLLTAGVADGRAAPKEPRSPARLELVGIPPSHSPGDELNIALEVANRSQEVIEGFSLNVSVFERVDSRSTLHAVFDEPPAFEDSSFGKDYERRLPSGASTTVVLEETMEEISVLAESDDGGVYPVKIELFDSEHTSFLDDKPVTVPLIYYPSEPQTPLNLSLAMPLNNIPRQDPQGAFPAAAGARSPLEEAVAPAGWLTQTVRVLRRWTAAESEPAAPTGPPRGTNRSGGRDTPVPPGGRGPGDRETSGRAPGAPGGIRLALAPLPRLVEELASMREGYRRVAGGATTQLSDRSAGAVGAEVLLRRLDSLLARPSVQPMVGPYSFASLPALEGSFGFPDGTAGQQQLTVGERVLDNVLQTEFEPEWVMAPEGRLDVTSLESLKLGNRGDMTLFAEDSLRSPANPSNAGCPEGSPSFACPVSTRTEGGATTGYVIDGGLEERFEELARPGEDALDLQKLLAETATIWAELPGRSGRVVHVTAPATWRPEPALMEQLFESLATSPWLTTVTPSEGLDGAQPPAARALVERLPASEAQIEAIPALDLGSAHATIESLSAFGAPDSLVDRLRRNVLVSQSSLWWGEAGLLEQGAEYAGGAEDQANDEMRLVRVGAPERITLTSRTGRVKLEVFNDAAYPARVELVLFSAPLNLNERIVKTIPAGKQLPLTIETAAKTSGTFPLSVTVETSDGYAIPGRSTDVLITSTQLNRIALGLTVGALVFLVFFYLSRAIRRRRARPREDGAGAPAA